jgi:tetratricopeptide (TPR) repeat protein
MKLLFEAVNADPNNEWAYRQLAAVYRETKPQEYDHAIDSAKRAIALSNSDLAYWSLAEVYLDMYDTSSAVQTLQKALTLSDSDQVETYVRLVSVYQQRGEMDVALRTIHNAMKAFPKSDRLWLTARSLAQWSDCAPFRHPSQPARARSACNTTSPSSYRPSRTNPCTPTASKRDRCYESLCSGTGQFPPGTPASRTRERKAASVRA